MTSKRWRMVVSNLSGDEIRQEVTVESANWMAALRAGRAEIGESGGVPTGSSCSVSPEGSVTILDPMARRRFVLSVDTAESFAPKAPKGPKVPPDEKAPAPAPKEEAAAAPEPAPKKKVPKKTMAYIPADQVPSAPAPKKKAPKKTMAYIPADQVPGAAAAEAPKAEPEKPAAREPAPTPEAPASAGFGPASAPAEEAPAPAAEAPAPAAEAPEPAKPTSDAPSVVAADASQGEGESGAWRLHSERDAEPSAENPLTYRERAYVVPAGTSASDCEAIAQERLTAIQESIADRPRGKFINLAIFDHDWKGRPQKPPVVTLQFKDWQDSLVVDRPLQRLTEAAKASSDSKPPPAPRGRTSTDEHDQRLATAFEASQDLLFLSTPIEGLEFALELFEDLADAEAMAACIYDIDDDVHRVAAAQGPGAAEMRGRAIPFQGGLFGVAARTPNAAFRVPDVSAEGRFDPAVDGWDGVDVKDLLYVPLTAQGRFLGMIQLINRKAEGGFSQADADLATYIGQQLASFLHKARLKAG